jgi:pimeloyl-ACP methyl ester carboxylesterase
VSQPSIIAGYFGSGLPYNRFGHGSRIAVIFQGLMFEHKPLARLSAPLMTRMYRFLDAQYTTYLVSRKPGLPRGYSMQNMADDYAEMIREQFGGPVDVIGTSTGGSIAQHFVANHPNLVRRLVIHSSAYTLGELGKQAQLRIAHFARQRQWWAANAVVWRLLVPPSWAGGVVVALGSRVMALHAPGDPADLIITIEAEDQHDFKSRLAEIHVPTLVVAGENDPFYTAGLFRETAAGISHARLILYSGMGHPAMGKQFEHDVLMFLIENNTRTMQADSGMLATSKVEW